jgi:hypothetical protein
MKQLIGASDLTALILKSSRLHLLSSETPGIFGCNPLSQHLHLTVLIRVINSSSKSDILIIAARHIHSRIQEADGQGCCLRIPGERSLKAVVNCVEICGCLTTM